jgi:hypothetical protein
MVIDRHTPGVPDHITLTERRDIAETPATHDEIGGLLVAACPRKRAGCIRGPARPATPPRACGATPRRVTE